MNDNQQLTTTGIDTPVVSEFMPNQTVQNLLAKERETLLRQIGTSKLKLKAEQKAALMRPADDGIIQVLPGGQLYVPGVIYRRVLNEVFDPLSWGIRPGSTHLDVHDGPSKQRSILYREVFLIVKGVCVATALGAAEYHPNNPRTTYDDAAESATTNGLTRCCKPLGLFSNIWDPAFAAAARDRLCVHVYCANGNYQATQWRRVDQPPFRSRDGEIIERSVVKDSPNAGRWKESYPSLQASQTAPPPPASVEQKASASPEKKRESTPEKVLVIRPISLVDAAGEKQQFWVVNTDAAEYLTDNREVVRELESLRTRHARIVPSYEERQGTRGTRKMLMEFTVVQ